MAFPKKFLWGVSNSGFQFEMGDLSGKNIDPNTDWYVWVHDPSNIRKGIVSGDLPEKGGDYWSLYKQDHAIAKQLGLNAYRIGVEWSRIFPKSTSAVKVEVERASDGNIAQIEVDDSALEKLEKLADQSALSHYRAVIEDLHAKGFEVFLCLNHFTLPLWIHDPITVRRTRLRVGAKGWVDENTVVEFTKYAAYMAWKLGGLVKHWATFNEPMVAAEGGYMISESGFPPGLRTAFRAYRKVAMHLVVAHARAYDVIKKFCNNANVGLINNVIPVMPLSPQKKSDLKAAEYLNMVHNRLFIQAISKGWLDENLNEVKEKGEIEAYLGNRLDWLGINYYSRLVVKGREFMLAKYVAGTTVIPSVVQGFGFASQPYSKSTDGLLTSAAGWELYPEGLLNALRAMKEFGKPLYVTENGISDANDVLRPSFLVEHLKVLDKAINEEKIDVRGYFHWALTDNYEWAKGFGQKFGLYSVDSETKLRTSRKSAEVFKKIVAGDKRLLQ
ncbi:MAG: beta-galactosidase BgaS [Candidatus Bathyarchaeota archaeon]|nr:beta-galactosidase BgaS [Candidatus Bathyarchaeota archaeon]